LKCLYKTKTKEDNAEDYYEHLKEIIRQRYNSPSIKIERDVHSNILEKAFERDYIRSLDVLSNYYNNLKIAIESQPDLKERVKKLSELEKTLSNFKNMDESVLQLIGDGNRHLLTPNYSAEMAIKYYSRALETHTEGAAYKEMILNVYLLDDDINNANITFSLALERYAINTGAISTRMNELKHAYANATYYELGNFINPHF
jgi:hypothetical protein